MTKNWRVFIGGSIAGLLVGAILGGFTVLVVGGTMFIDYSLNQDKVCTTLQEISQKK